VPWFPTTTSPSPATRLVAGGLLMGTLGIFLSEAGQHPLTAVFFRCVFGAVAIASFALAVGRLSELKPSRSSLVVAGLTGALMTAMWASFFAAIQWTSIAVATVAFHFQPVWVLLAGAWWMGDKLTPSRSAAIAMALVGLALATGLTSKPVTADPWFALGLTMALLGSVCYAAVTLIARQQRSITSLGLTFWQCAVGSALLAWWPWVHELPARAAGWPLATWFWLAGLGVLHTGFAYALMYGAMQRLPPGRIAVLQFVYPIAAIVLDGVVYGRALDASQWLGVVLMGVALAWAGRAGSAPRSPTPGSTSDKGSAPTASASRSPEADPLAASTQRSSKGAIRTVAGSQSST
jgi:drug/metabolite transporter (DMT)-like permease